MSRNHSRLRLECHVPWITLVYPKSKYLWFKQMQPAIQNAAGISENSSCMMCRSKQFNKFIKCKKIVSWCRGSSSQAERPPRGGKGGAGVASEAPSAPSASLAEDVSLRGLLSPSASLAGDVSLRGLLSPSPLPSPLHGAIEGGSILRRNLSACGGQGA